MNTVRKIGIVLSLNLCGLICFAQNGTKNAPSAVPHTTILFIQKTDGTLIQTPFNQDSEVLLLDGQIKLKTLSGEQLFTESEIEFLTFDPVALSIVKTSVQMLQVRIDEKSILYVSDGEPLQQVSLYDATGKQLKAVATENSTVQIGMSDVPAGIYIVKTQKKSAKIVKQ